MAGQYRFKVRRINPGSDPVLLEGEPGLDPTTLIFKMGDGSRSWSQLPFHQPRTTVVAEDVPAALADHINSAQPHPVYDDGPSLLLLYENAKV